MLRRQKHQLNFNIPAELVKKLDDLIDGVYFRNRAQLITSILARYVDDFRYTKQAVMPMKFSEGARLIPTAMAGGKHFHKGFPKWIIVTRFEADGEEHDAYYRLDRVSIDGVTVKPVSVGGEDKKVPPGELPGENRHLAKRS